MTTVASSKVLIELLLGLGRGQSPSYIEGESPIRALNQKCVRNGVVDVTHARAHDPFVFIKDFAFLQDGDVCINSTGTGTIGRVGLWTKASNVMERFFADSHVTIARPDAELINPSYLAALLQSPAVQTAIETYCFSGSTNQVELNKTALSELQLSLLSREEQDAVAEVMVCIDRAIEQTEALIAKQQRIKTGLMQDLLTKGIDEHGNIRSETTHAFKDSPLGRIPVEWEAKLLKVALREAGGFLKTGPFGSQLHSHEYVHEGVPVIMPQDIIFGEVSLSSIARIPEVRANDLRRHRVSSNDIVFARRGDLSRAAAISKHETGWVCGTGCFLLRVPVNKMDASWLADVYRHHQVQVQVNTNAVGSTMPSLNNTVMEQLLIAFPGVEEQRQITHFRDSADLAISSTAELLEKLQLLKAGLMHDLLTGERRVTPLLKTEPDQPDV